MRFDVALVHRLGGVVALYHDLGQLEAGVGVALHIVNALGDVRRLGRHRLHALGDQMVVQQRCTVLHRLGDVDDVRQHLVLDLDQRQGRIGNGVGGGRDRGDGMALIERLLAGHDVARDVAQVDLHLAGGDDQVGLLGEVLRRHHGFYARQLLGGRDVDRLDQGVGVRAAQHLADQLAGHVEVGAETGAARHLVGAVGTVRTRADPLVLLLAHRVAPLMSAATSMTARTILS